MVAIRKFQVQTTFFTRLGTQDPLFKALYHAASSQVQGEVFCFAAVEGHTIDIALEVHIDTVAVLGRAFHIFVFGTLLADVFDGFIHVGVLHFHHRLFDLHLGHGGQLDLRHDLEDRIKFQPFSRLYQLRLYGRITCRLEILLLNRLIVTGLHHITDDFAANLIGVFTTDDGKRYLTRTKSIYSYARSHGLQSLFYLIGNLLFGNSDSHAAFQGARRLDRYLHF